MVGDVDALQGLYLRGIGPPAAAIVVAVVVRHGAALILPAAGLILAVGLLLARRRRAAALGDALAARRAGAQAHARGELTADLVELLRGAPELVLYGREEERLEAVREADRRARAPRPP